MLHVQLEQPSPLFHADRGKKAIVHRRGKWASMGIVGVSAGLLYRYVITLK